MFRKQILQGANVALQNYICNVIGHPWEKLQEDVSSNSVSKEKCYLANLAMENIAQNYIQHLCLEWQLNESWFNLSIYKNHNPENHCHSANNPFGFHLVKIGETEFITGAHLHLGNEIVGGHNLANSIMDIRDIDKNNIALIATEQADRFLDSLQRGLINMIKDKNALTLGLQTKTNSDQSDQIELKMQGGAVPDVEDKVSTGYDTKRLNKYDKSVSGASLGEVASAFGESLDEVMNRRDIQAEEKLCRDALGTTMASLVMVEKTFPSFYIPLAIMGLDAVLNDQYKILTTVNFAPWSGKIAPVTFANFEVNYNEKKRLMTGSTRVCESKNNGTKILIKAVVEKTMNGPIYVINAFATNKNTDLANKIIADVEKWMQTNNYYRGKKIGADGSFLNVSAYDWKDFVCPSDMKDNIFDDVVGFLNHADYYRKNDLPFKRGLILYGRPGCGKTLLGKVVANKINSSFIWVTAAQATTPAFIKDLFQLAREIAPTVLFFEDIDMYTVDRSFGIFNPKVGEMLAQMDGMEENNGMIVVATTNKIDAIEKALAERPSRFDRRYCLDYMDESCREEMVRQKLTNAILQDITPNDIAQLVLGLNGSFIQEVVISAKRKAISRGQVDENGIAILNKDLINESVAEVKEAFNIAIEKVDRGMDPSQPWGSNTTYDGPSKWHKEHTSESVIACSKENHHQLTLATAKTPRNVNLTNTEKNEIDGEVKAALATLASALEGDKAQAKPYTDDDSLDAFAVKVAGAHLEDIKWNTLTKSALRQMFRMFVLAKNVRRSLDTGKDPLNDKKMLGSLLHAMDMLSDRYYWTNALARIETNFGRKVELPFNPYKDQTSTEASVRTYDQITGKIPSARKQEDKVNRANGLPVPPVLDGDAPDFQFNQPQKAENITKPDQVK